MHMIYFTFEHELLTSKFLEYPSVFILSAPNVFVTSLFPRFINLQEFTITFDEYYLCIISESFQVLSNPLWGDKLSL